MRRNRLHRIPLDVRGMMGSEAIFRVAGAVQRDPAVDTWLADGPVELRLIAREWFEQLRLCGDDVRELIHDGCPVACVEDAPFGYVNTFTSHVNVGFFCGAMLDDPAGMLQGSGKRMRHVKLKPGAAFDSERLRGLIRAAYVDIKVRLDGEQPSQLVDQPIRGED